MVLTLVWDEKKRLSNLKKHRLKFEDAVRFDWGTALIGEDESMDYGEARMVALGWIDTLVVMIYVDATIDENEETVQIISLRKATKAERKYYAENA